MAFIPSVSQRFGDQESNVSDDIQNVDFGVSFGIGWNVPVRSHAIVVDGRFSAGFRDLTRSADTSMRSRVFTFLLGYRF
jgi:hypothetical protein